VQTIEKRQGIKIGCPEEAAYRNGFIADSDLDRLASQMPNCEYRNYLRNLLTEGGL
jgi:glucose-1-phosphate thymidylyltransferase